MTEHTTDAITQRRTRFADGRIVVFFGSETPGQIGGGVLIPDPTEIGANR